MSHVMNLNDNRLIEEGRLLTSTSQTTTQTSQTTDNNRLRNNNIYKYNRKPRFGILFDVDGVLARGTIPLDSAREGFKSIVDSKGDFRVPVTFVTNALNRNIDKANQIGGWFNIHVKTKQMIQAQGPLQVFSEFHDKFCLIIGQGFISEIARDLGFKRICTIEDVAEAYPLLDMVDHSNRKRVARDGYTEKGMDRIEAIILLGEPKRWETPLQLLVDLLKTNGKPDKAPECMPETHLPIIACNMDLQFMDRACMPRYGHGAFLLCLEALYKKVTGNELKYTSLIGKPSEVTFRYAEHCLHREAESMGIDEDLERMYIVGDTPEVDIVGGNLYQRYIRRLHTRRSNMESNKEREDMGEMDPELPQSRNMPHGTNLSKQTVSSIESILVTTGVYKPGQSPEKEGDEKNYHGHRDFPRITELYKPSILVDTVADAIDYILEKENFSCVEEIES